MHGGAILVLYVAAVSLSPSRGVFATAVAAAALVAGPQVGCRCRRSRSSLHPALFSSLLFSLARASPAAIDFSPLPPPHRSLISDLELDSWKRWSGWHGTASDTSPATTRQQIRCRLCRCCRCRGDRPALASSPVLPFLWPGALLYLCKPLEGRRGARFDGVHQYCRNCDWLSLLPLQQKLLLPMLASPPALPALPRGSHPRCCRYCQGGGSVQTPAAGRPLSLAAVEFGGVRSIMV